MVTSMSDKRVNLRLSETLYAAIKKRADAIGLTVTTYVKALVVDDARKESK